jgi:hypothetical protein
MKTTLITAFTFLVVVCLACLLASCASEHRRATAWQPTQAGCSNHSLLPSLLSWNTAPLSAASFRLAIQPDTGQGPIILVLLDSGKSLKLGQPDKPPSFIGAVGGLSRTCVIRVPFSQCPAARSVYNSLRHKSIPLGFAFDHPNGITVLHGRTYYLGYSDGQGNHNQWRFYGTDNPLQTAMRKAIGKLARQQNLWVKLGSGKLPSA